MTGAANTNQSECYMAYGIKMNVKAPHRFLRMGALCWLNEPNLGCGSERIRIWGMSRGGRMVQAWVNPRDLHTYRVGYVCDPPIATPATPLPRRFSFHTREEAAAWAVSMNTRFTHQNLLPVVLLRKNQSH